ncbi:MAG: hypothetical protein K2L51_01065 [Clostridiales bacterium]|nr:hypothetical protein [Clostridiales bacterium]
MATFSPEFVREQSRQNLSDMARLTDGLYQRADTPEAREALATMSKAVSSLKPVGSVPQVLDVESQLKKVLADYNANLDEDRAEGVDKATVSIIGKLVATRKKMSAVTVDADFKRGFKSYRKANKGVGKKKELKAAYEVRYREAMEETDRYVREAKTLDQLVKSYQLRTREMRKQSELAELNAAVQSLAAKYKKSADQAERDRMNAEYQTLLRKKKALDAALMGYKDAQKNVATVEALLSQLSAQEETREIDNIAVEDFTELANAVTAGIKKARGRNAAFDEAYGAVESATDAALRRAGERNAAGETLDSVVLAEINAGLDEVGGTAARNAAPTLDDIADTL